ncbi:MAG: PTS sugar transporter subunit IIA [Holosporales bacterium]|jgi:PTS system mannose-specific IIA component|nr:PTS sugar transporter subunit IIA [Holosporales bacterium]
MFWFCAVIGVVIVSHGNLGLSLAESAEMILEEKNDIFAVSISSVSDNAEVFRKNILEAIDRADTGSGVIVFTDLFGGTPCNLAISAFGVKNIEIIAGVNLPMVLKLLNLRNQNKDISIKEAVNCVETAGKKQISIVSEIIK